MRIGKIYREPKQPLKFGAPEKTNWTVIILTAVFVTVVVAGIAALLITSPREKTLVCDNDMPTSLTSFGACHEE